MGRFRIGLGGYFQELALEPAFQVGTVKEKVRNILKMKFDIFLPEELYDVQHMLVEVPFILHILYLASNSVAMLSITQNCASVNGLRCL